MSRYNRLYWDEDDWQLGEAYYNELKHGPDVQTEYQKPPVYSPRELTPEEKAASAVRQEAEKLRSIRKQRLMVNHLEMHHTFGFHIGPYYFAEWDRSRCSLWDRCRYR